MGRIFADTNVLFPFSVMDLLLALTEDGIHEVIWTDSLLDEWERVIVDAAHRSPGTAAAVTAAIREFFHDSKVERSEYEHLVDQMPGKDGDDHEHMAAAVIRQPCTILTKNTKDFPPNPLAKWGVVVADPDTYLCDIAEELPEEVFATLVRVASEKRRPPKTPHQLVDDLERAGLRRFAGMMRAQPAPGAGA